MSEIKKFPITEEMIKERIDDLQARGWDEEMLVKLELLLRDDYEEHDE